MQSNRSSIVLLLVLLSAVLAKERVEDQQIAQITDKLFKVLSKRINEWDLAENNGLDDCSFTFTNDSIIRTRDSIDAGATFIKSPVVESRESCQEICCDIANCNLAVFKEKVKENACYLFDCGTPSVCQFTGHPGFVVMEMPERQTTNKQQAKHEQALENLAATTEATTPEPTTTTTTTAPPTTTTTIVTTTVTVPQKTQPVALFGECESHKDCAGSATECLAGYCVCQEGYHAQDGACQQDKDTTGEKQSANTDEQSKTTLDKQPAKGEDKDIVDDESDEVLSEIINYLKGGLVGPVLSKALDTNPSFDVKPVVNVATDASVNGAGESDDTVIANKSTAVIQPQSTNNNQDKKDEVLTPAVDSSVDNSEDESSVVVKQEKLPVTVPQIPKAPVKENSDQSIEMDEVEETSIYISTTQKNRGAVIALALGLAITALLLVFVGCKLRNMKRRLRKGRPMNSNEADYLINGMYL